MAELEATAPEIDEIVAERFSDPRSAIAEHLRTGRNIDEVRFLLRRYFRSFVVRDNDGGRAIVANLRPDVVDDVMADLAGAKREALRGLTQQRAFYMGYCPHRRKGHVSGGTRDSRTLPRRTRLDRHACSSSRTVVWRTLDHTLACRPWREPARTYWGTWGGCVLNVLGFEPRVVAEQLRHSDGGIARGRGLYGYSRARRRSAGMRGPSMATVTPFRGTRPARTAVVRGNLGGTG
jgi:hypothetical protein